MSNFGFRLALETHSSTAASPRFRGPRIVVQPPDSFPPLLMEAWLPLASGPVLPRPQGTSTP